MDLWLLPSAQAFGAEDTVSELKKADEYLSGIISTTIKLLNIWYYHEVQHKNSKQLPSGLHCFMMGNFA